MYSFFWLSNIPLYICTFSLCSWSSQYARKFGKISTGHRTGKGQFSFHTNRIHTHTPKDRSVINPLWGWPVQCPKQMFVNSSQMSESIGINAQIPVSVHKRSSTSDTHQNLLGAAGTRKEPARQLFPSRLSWGPLCPFLPSVLLLWSFLLIFGNNNI